jgi:hypothetical protein
LSKIWLHLVQKLSDFWIYYLGGSILIGGS